MVNFKIADGKGSGNQATVEDKSLYVSDMRYPPKSTEIQVRIFRQYLTDDGTASGSIDMRVNGATTNVEFWVSSASDGDRYITSLSFAIVDASAVLNKFGNLTALTNGCQLFYEDSELGNVDLHDALKSNFDVVRLCQGNPAFGDAAGSFRASNVESTSEGYLPALDIQSVFGIDWGIRIPKDSTKRLVMKIKDDVTLLDAFNVIAYGFDRIID